MVNREEPFDDSRFTQKETKGCAPTRFTIDDSLFTTSRSDSIGAPSPWPPCRLSEQVAALKFQNRVDVRFICEGLLELPIKNLKVAGARGFEPLPLPCQDTSATSFIRCSRS